MEEAPHPHLWIDVLDHLPQRVIAVALGTGLAVLPLRQVADRVVGVLRVKQPCWSRPGPSLRVASNTLRRQAPLLVIAVVPLERRTQRFLQHLPGRVALDRD